MAEFLAANGFVVVSLPSIAINEGERCGFDLACLKLQQADMEFAIQTLQSYPSVDANKIGLLAWSFSGLAVAHLQMKNPNVRAVVSMDAATGYQYGKEILDQSKEIDFNKTKVPFLHLHGLDNARVPKNFDFFKSFQSAEKYFVTFKSLQHSDFLPLYGDVIRLAKNDEDKNAIEGTRWVNLLTLKFLNAYLKNNPKALRFLKSATNNKDESTSNIFSFASSF
ncbi:MAG: acyl-CoA thioester hydrolase/BAAT C-terminal domain-containing protein [Acidobacteriota bacterium]